MGKALWELRGWLLSIAIVFFAGYASGRIKLKTEVLWDALSAAGAWVAGIGAFAAAGVALHISNRDRRERELDAKSRLSVREQQCAMILFPTLIDIANQAESLPRRLADAATGKFVELDKAQRLRVTGLEDLEGLIDRIDALEAAAAADVMRVLSLGRRFNRVLDRSTKQFPRGDNVLATISPGILADEGQKTLSELSGAAARARDYMNGVIVKADFDDLTKQQA